MNRADLELALLTLGPVVSPEFVERYKQYRKIWTALERTGPLPVEMMLNCCAEYLCSQLHSPPTVTAPESSPEPAGTNPSTSSPPAAEKTPPVENSETSSIPDHASVTISGSGGIRSGFFLGWKPNSNERYAKIATRQRPNGEWVHRSHFHVSQLSLSS